MTYLNDHSRRSFSAQIKNNAEFMPTSSPPKFDITSARRLAANDVVTSSVFLTAISLTIDFWSISTLESQFICSIKYWFWLAMIIIVWCAWFWLWQPSFKNGGYLKLFLDMKYDISYVLLLYRLVNFQTFYCEMRIA